MVKQLTIGNQLIQATFLPPYGGKMSSLVDMTTGVEFLLPPTAAYQLPEDGSFANGDRGGFDECLPSIAPCAAGDGYPAVPDHGELWCRGWRVLEYAPNAVTLSAVGPSGLELTRRAAVRDRTVDLTYTLRNRSAEDRPWIWSSHPLLMVDEGDVIQLPESVTDAKVGFSSFPAFVEEGIVDWPVARCGTASVDLAVVGAADGETAHKLFVNAGCEGWCVLHRPKRRLSLRLEFPTDELAYLGLWICLGAWPADACAKQYTVALEPTTAPTDSLVEALRTGTAKMLEPQQSRQWSMSMIVVPVP